ARQVVLVDLRKTRLPPGAGRAADAKNAGPQRSDAVRLEIQYLMPQRLSAGDAAALEAPTLPDEVPVHRMYWEVVLHSRQHLLAGPEDFTSEMAWGWQGWFW